MTKSDLFNFGYLSTFIIGQGIVCLAMISMAGTMKRHADSEKQLADAHTIVAASQNAMSLQLADAIRVGGYATLILVPQKAQETTPSWVMRYASTIAEVSAQ